MAEEQASDPARHRDLYPVERSFAGVLGALGVGVGGVGVFLSANQAGTTAILLVGAVFVIMAVQGTPITKLGKEAAEFAARERRATTLLDQAQDALQAGQPQAATAYLDGIRHLLAPRDPRPGTDWLLRTDPYVFRQRTVHAIRQDLGQHMPQLWVAEPLNSFQAGYHALISDSEHPKRQVAVQLSNLDFDAAALEHLHAQVRALGLPTLLITDGFFAPLEQARLSVGDKSSDPPVIRGVQWTPADDRVILRDAIAELMQTYA